MPLGEYNVLTKLYEYLYKLDLGPLDLGAFGLKKKRKNVPSKNSNSAKKGFKMRLYLLSWIFSISMHPQAQNLNLNLI